MTLILGSAPCQGCRRPVSWGTAVSGPELAPRWRNANDPRNRIHRCQATRVDEEEGPVRLCPDCGEEWPLEDGYFARVTPGGYFRPKCRACS